MNLPNSYKAHDTFMLRDRAWGILFPKEYLQYRLRGSIKCAAKIKVLGLHGDQYQVALMECAPVEGKMIAPVNLTALVSLDTIHLALKNSLFVQPDAVRVRLTDPQDRKVTREKKKPIDNELLKNEPMRLRECWQCKKPAMILLSQRFCTSLCRRNYLDRVNTPEPL